MSVLGKQNQKKKMYTFKLFLDVLIGRILTHVRVLKYEYNYLRTKLIVLGEQSKGSRVRTRNLEFRRIEKR